MSGAAAISLALMPRHIIAIDIHTHDAYARRVYARDILAI